MAKTTEQKWRHVQGGRIGVPSMQGGDEYIHDMQCMNCRKTFCIAIKKKTSIMDVVEQVDCPNCGVVQYGASKNWVF